MEILFFLGMFVIGLVLVPIHRRSPRRDGSVATPGRVQFAVLAYGFVIGGAIGMLAGVIGSL